MPLCTDVPRSPSFGVAQRRLSRDAGSPRLSTSLFPSRSGRSRSILIASGTFHPESGGPPTYLLTLGRELTRRGHAVRVVTYGDAPSDRRYPYPVHRIPRGLPVPSRLALFAREVWRHGQHADLLFVNDYGLPATLANLALRKPVVMKVVGDFAWEYAVRHGLIPPDEPFEQFQRSRYGPKVEALRLMQRTYVRAADRVIVPSSFVRWYVEGWGADPDGFRVVHNAVEDLTAGLGPDRAAVRASLGVGPDERVVLAVVRLTRWKGVDTVIAALDGLLREGQAGARLVVWATARTANDSKRWHPASRPAPCASLASSPATRSVAGCTPPTPWRSAPAMRGSPTSCWRRWRPACRSWSPTSAATARWCRTATMA